MSTMPHVAADFLDTMRLADPNATPTVLATQDAPRGMWRTEIAKPTHNNACNRCASLRLAAIMQACLIHYDGHTEIDATELEHVLGFRDTLIAYLVDTGGRPCEQP